MANVEQNETTRVFRMPSSDATAPDLMKSTPLIVPVLSIIKGPQTGNVFELDQPEVTIGRDPSNTIFLNDMTVSRMHATLDRVPGGYKIVDADSFNGLWVNNLNMKEAVLNDGDVVQIGTFCLLYQSTPRV